MAIAAGNRAPADPVGRVRQKNAAIASLLVRLGRLLTLLAILYCEPMAALNDPFPMGYSMMNFGTIMWENGVSGRQPWMPAAFLNDSAMFGFSAAGIDYYDDMDNLRENDIRQGAAGGWLRAGALRLKAAYVHFDALRVYRESKGYVSVGTSIIPFVSVSTELSGYRVGLVSRPEEREHVACAGVTVWAPWSFASASLSAENILLKDAHRPGFAPPLRFRAGIHSAPHRFGAQGVVVEIEPEEELTIRFRAGEEFWFHKLIGLSVSMSTNPLMVGFGATVRFSSFGAYATVVHHPVLGWSKGTGVEYRRAEEKAGGEKEGEE